MSTCEVYPSATLQQSALRLGAALTSSLQSEVGPLPYWYQSTPTTPASQTVVDYLGILKGARPNEALFYGARRVENLVRYSEHLSFTNSSRWDMLNGLTVAPVENVLRPGINGDMTAWKVVRAATGSSVLRTNAFLRRRDMPTGLDLLSPVPHFVGINARRSDTNVVSVFELEAYVSGSGPVVSKFITIDDTMRTYGITFTPQAPKRITGLSWASGVLTVTCPAHGYASGNSIRLSGSLPAAFDADTSVASVVNANTFTVSMGSNPGTATSFGWVQYGYRIGLSPNNFASTAAGDIEVEFPYVAEYFGYPAGYVPEYVPHDASPPDRYWYGAAVDGVRYFDTEPGWMYNATTGLVTRGTGAALATCRGLATFSQSVNLVPRKFGEIFGGWTKADASMTISDLSDTSPMGGSFASRIVEGTHTGRHYAELPAGVLTTTNVGTGVLSNVSVFLATPGGSSGRDWTVLTFVDRAGAEQFAYVDLANGIAGNKTTGVRALALESLATLGGLHYYRVHMRVTSGSGATTPMLRVGLASANGTSSYTGDGNRYLVAWGVDVVSGSGRPVASPYARAHQELTATRAGSMIQYNTRGIVGTQDFTVMSKCTPYFDPLDVDRQEWSGITYMDCGGPQFSAGATSTWVTAATGDRLGAFFRPNMYPGSVHFSKIALDLYRGDPTPAYIFRVGKAYDVDDYVVPSDTRANNLNNRKLWRVKVAGVSGAEPTWPTVTSLPSADVVSGTVTFVCDHDNGIIGSWEPYDGAQLAAPSGFMTEVRAGWYLTAGNYSIYVNGVEGVKQTAPVPVDPIGLPMRYPPKVLALGRLTSDTGVDPNTYTNYMGSDGAGLMPRLTMFHRDVQVWSGEGHPTTELATLTA